MRLRRAKVASNEGVSHLNGWAQPSAAGCLNGQLTDGARMAGRLPPLARSRGGDRGGRRQW